jgi:hypothetical protein
MTTTFGFLGSSDDGGQWKSNTASPKYRGSGEQFSDAGFHDSAGAWYPASSLYYTKWNTQVLGILGLKDSAGAWMDSNGLYWTPTYTFSGLPTAPNPYVGQIFPTGGKTVPSIGQLT